MRKKGLIFCFLFVLLIGITSAAVVCSDSSQIIMKLSNTNNAHGALWNDANYDGFEICYDTIFGVSYDSNENVVLNTNPTGVVTLMEGWNLVSFPTINPVPSLDLVAFCPGVAGGIWYLPRGEDIGSFATLSDPNLSPGIGYSIYSKESCDFDISSYGLADHILVTLHEGWNLLGGADVPDINTVYTTAGEIWEWDTQRQDYASATSGSSQKGYFVFWEDGTRPTTCANPILSLTDETNAHAEDGSLNTAGYDVDVCYADLDCTVTSEECVNEGERCIVKLSSVTNAHLAECDSTDYDFNLCCSVKDAAALIATTSCESEGRLCGNYVNDIGETLNCDNIVGGGCSGGTVCQLSNGQCSSEPRFWSTLDDLTEAIDEINILIEGGDVLMNLKDQGILADGQIEFSITNDGNEVRTILSDEVSNPNLVSVPWSISQSDLVDSDLEEEFFFRVEGGTSLPLKINVLTQCFEVSFCSDYKSQPDCDSDQVLCTVGEIGVENNNPSVNCWDDSGGYNYNCGCKWNEDPQQGINKCGPKYFRVDHDPERPGYDPSWEGSCTFSETTTDTCDDEFLSYSWSGAWDDGNSSFTSDPGDVNFREDPATGDWYYDPLTSKGILSESQFCEQSVGEKVVPCPSQIKLPFFGFWQIFSSLSLIAFIYVVMVFRKN